MQTDQIPAVEALIQRLLEQGQTNTASAIADLFSLARRMGGIQNNHVSGAKQGAVAAKHNNGSVPHAFPAPFNKAAGARPTESATVCPCPPALARGQRSQRAFMLALAEMHLKGVSRPDLDVLSQKLGLETLSAEQYTLAARQLDELLEDWCQRPLGETRYLMLAERTAGVREGGLVCDFSILSAIGIGPDGRRRILGALCAMQTGDSHWQHFLQDLINRGLQGVRFVVSDNHDGLRDALEALIPSVVWQRSQYHLTQDAKENAQGTVAQKRLDAELREIWGASSAEAANGRLQRLAEQYRSGEPGLVAWLTENIPDGFGVFSLPEAHRRHMRSTNSLDRTIQLQFKKVSQRIRIFPSKEALERLLRATLVEFDEKWSSADHPYIAWSRRKEQG